MFFVMWPCRYFEIKASSKICRFFLFSICLYLRAAHGLRCVHSKCCRFCFVVYGFILVFCKISMNKENERTLLQSLQFVWGLTPKTSNSTNNTSITKGSKLFMETIHQDFDCFQRTRQQFTFIKYGQAKAFVLLQSGPVNALPNGDSTRLALYDSRKRGGQAFGKRMETLESSKERKCVCVCSVVRCTKMGMPFSRLMAVRVWGVRI